MDNITCSDFNPEFGVLLILGHYVDVTGRLVIPPLWWLRDTLRLPVPELCGTMCEVSALLLVAHHLFFGSIVDMVHFFFSFTVSTFCGYLESEDFGDILHVS